MDRSTLDKLIDEELSKLSVGSNPVSIRDLGLMIDTREEVDISALHEALLEQPDRYAFFPGRESDPRAERASSFGYVTGDADEPRLVWVAREPADVARFMAENAPPVKVIREAGEFGGTYTTAAMAIAESLEDIAETPEQYAGIPIAKRFASEIAAWELPLV